MNYNTIETVPETPEQKKLRIEKEKKEIDEDIERNRTATEKRHKKINDAKKFLESEGFEVKKLLW